MPRTSRDSDMSSPTARRRLKPKPNRSPHWRALGDGRFLGYRPAAVGPGFWAARLYLGEGKYLEDALLVADDEAPADGVSILSYRQAVDAALAWCRQGRDQEVDSPYTVRESSADYLEWYRGHRKAYTDAARRIAVDILPFLGDVAVEDLTTSQLRQWHQGIAERPARFRPGKQGQKVRKTDGPEGVRQRKNSANRSLTTLRALLNFAVSDGKVPATAAGIWKPIRPFREVDKPRVRYFDSGEVSRLLNGCDPDFRKLVTGALLTGARYGELTTLKVRDFALETGYVEVHGKVGRRTIFLNAEGVDFFNGLTAARELNAPMFTRDDGEPWARSHQTRRMEEATVSAKIPKPNNFHILRHTYASLFLMAGGSLEGLARQLGHGDTRMTIRSYAHLAETWRASEARAHAPSFGLTPSGVVRLTGRGF